MKNLWIELQRWNKQRVAVCDQCGSFSKRNRAPVIHAVAQIHSQWNPGHTVKVKRFG